MLSFGNKAITRCPVLSYVASKLLQAIHEINEGKRVKFDEPKMMMVITKLIAYACCFFIHTQNVKFINQQPINQSVANHSKLLFLLNDLEQDGSYSISTTGCISASYTLSI